LYYAHFGLREPPFTITPNTEFFFSGGNRGAVLEALIYAITHDQGIIKLTGEVGSGKTMTCRMLQERLPANVETVYIASPSVSPVEILRAIAHELRLAVPKSSGRLEITQAIHEHLLKRHAENKKVVVFVEESQNMPIETLEEIRLLSNLETGKHKLLQIVLFGQPELDENLRRQEIRQLKDRITQNFSLSPLSPEQVQEYLTHRLRAAGYRGPDLFSPSIARCITKASSGLTRRVNIVADKTLLAAFADNTHTVTLRHARRAVKDIEIKLGRRPFMRLGVGAAWLVSGIALGISIYWLYQSLAPEPTQTTSENAAPVVPAPAAEQQAPISFATAAVEPMRSATGALDAVEEIDTLQSRLQATQQWLASESSGTYSIQLLGSFSEEQTARYLESLPPGMDKVDIYVFRTIANQKPLLTVLYGSYPNRQSARSALESLPAEFKTHNPYLRTVGGIRAEIASKQ
jgi:type II secretory pathway predicted ATPase ExeA